MYEEVAGLPGRAGLPGSHLTSAGVLQVKYYCIRIPFSHLGDSNYL